MKNIIYFLAALIILPAGVYAEDNSVMSSLRSFAGDTPQVSVPVPAISPKVIDEAPVTKAQDMSGDELFNYLSRSYQVKETRGSISYSSARRYMYSVADNTGCDGRPGIITFYSQICANGSSEDGNTYHEQGDENRDGVIDKIINAEHLWPQSFFGKSMPMVADLHHLQPTFQTPNGRRSNYKFCETNNSRYSTSSGSKLAADGDCFEPADAVKGNVARAMFYFVTLYHNKNIRQGGINYREFWTNNIPMFLKWNRMDPPDENEKRRNDLVEKFQNNRNPYVDNYQLADQIGADTFAKY